MRFDLENLVRDFPALFRLRHQSGDGPREPISFGFEIESGWEPIVRRLSEKLEPIARETSLRAAQVKEKNGELRFYVEHEALPADVGAQVKAVLAEAREQSTRTCELCGADGVLRGERRVQTLCIACADRLGIKEAAVVEGADPEDLYWATNDDLQAQIKRAREPGRPKIPHEEVKRRFGLRERIKPNPEESEKRYEPLLARRIPREQIVVGRAYVIHARNGGVGVAVEEDGRIGYVLHREKGGNHFLDGEQDWGEGPPFGTAIPLKLIEAEPPVDDDALLAWLTKQEDEHRAEIDAAWESVLGHPISRRGPG